MSDDRERRAKKVRRRLNSTLDQHKQKPKTKIQQPPFKQMENLRFVHWAPDILPDMLWPALMFTLYDPFDAFVITCHALNYMVEELAEYATNNPDVKQPIIDARLTSFERVPVDFRQRIIDRLRREEIYEAAFPIEFVHSLGMYTGAPGSWLIEPQRRDLSIDWEIAQESMDQALTECNDGRSEISTFCKALLHRQWVKAGRLSIAFETDIPELLHKYPFNSTKDEFDHVNAHIRASFNMLIGFEEERAAASLDWSRRFWRTNWSLFLCRRPDPAIPSSSSRADVEAAIKRMAENLQHLEDDVLQAATKADPDLYNPDRFEVMTGVVVRAIRQAWSVVTTPSLWSTEIGSSPLRSVVESLITVAWLNQREDPAMYTRYKDYGRGRLKLQMLHLEAFVDSQEDPKQETLDYLDQLRKRVNDDVYEEFQDIDLSSTFSGVSMRQMAKEAGMEVDYQLYFAPASGIAHGEWSSLDRYALVRCLNPLHRFHRIPQKTYGFSLDSDLALMVLSYVERLVDLYLETIGSIGVGLNIVVGQDGDASSSVPTPSDDTPEPSTVNPPVPDTPPSSEPDTPAGPRSAAPGSSPGPPPGTS